MATIIKLYAAYKAGYLGNNILDTYFSFMANMISEEGLTVVEDTVVAAKFKERYTMELPLPFIRQVLGGWRAEREFYRRPWQIQCGRKRDCQVSF